MIFIIIIILIKDIIIIRIYLKFGFKLIILIFKLFYILMVQEDIEDRIDDVGIYFHIWNIVIIAKSEKIGPGL